MCLWALCRCKLCSETLRPRDLQVFVQSNLSQLLAARLWPPCKMRDLSNNRADSCSVGSQRRVYITYCNESHHLKHRHQRHHNNNVDVFSLDDVYQPNINVRSNLYREKCTNARLNRIVVRYSTRVHAHLCYACVFESCPCCGFFSKYTYTETSVAL